MEHDQEQLPAEPGVGADGVHTRGRLRATIASFDVREAPSSTYAGRGLYLGRHRLDRDDVEQLHAELHDWLHGQ